MTETSHRVDISAETAQERLMDFALTLKGGGYMHGFSHGAMGGGGGWTHRGFGGNKELGKFVMVDVPLSERHLFSRTINTALFHTITPSDEPTTLLSDLEYTEDYDVDTLVLDTTGSAPLATSHTIHVPFQGLSIHRSHIRNQLGYIGGEYPPENSYDLVDLDWHEATDSDIHEAYFGIRAVIDASVMSE